MKNPSKNLSLFVRLHAKPEMAAVLAEFLTQASTLAHTEDETVTWYAVQFNAQTFAIFDTFADEAGRQKHLHGKIAAALMANADRLLAQPPHIELGHLLAAK